MQSSIRLNNTERGASTSTPTHSSSLETPTTQAAVSSEAQTPAMSTTSSSNTLTAGGTATTDSSNAAGTVTNIQTKNLSHAEHRPSPVKFTSQRPKQFPVKPKPERLPPMAQTPDSNQCLNEHSSFAPSQKDDEISENSGSQRPMLSLETLKDFTDFGKEEVMIVLTEAVGDYPNHTLALLTNY